MSAEGTETSKLQSKRDRAFLGQLPSDFLRVESAVTAQSSTGYVYMYMHRVYTYLYLDPCVPYSTVYTMNGFMMALVDQ